jgi:ribosomal protein L40E
MRCPARPSARAFQDRRCGGVAELRSVILKARRLANDDAERERAAAAAKTWLLAQIENKRPARSADIAAAAPDEPLAPERLAVA